MTKVHCTVADCEYWGDDNYCTASEILIAGPGLPPSENVNHHGRGTEEHSTTPAARKDGTYCYTFEQES